jgi:hypothetical protein
VGFVAVQLGLDPVVFGEYDWSGRTIRYHREQIREHLGFRLVTVEDEGRLTEWLTVQVAVAERRSDRVIAALIARFAEERIELPTPGRGQRMVRSSLHNAEQRWAETIRARLPPDARRRLLALIETVDDDDDVRCQDSLLGLVKRAPGNVSLESMLVEINKLEQLRTFKLPAGLLVDVATKVLAGWRPQASRPWRPGRHSPKRGPVLVVVFPAVAGGEQTLRDLALEFKSTGPTYRRTVQTKLRSSYTAHYRRGLIALLDTLEC